MKLRQLLILVAVILGFVALQQHHFHNYNYRQDEAWVVHAVIAMSVGELFDALAVSPSLPTYLMLLDGWIAFFGHHEVVTRFLSTLIAIIGLAIVYRLAKDESDYRTGVMAVILLGTLNFIIFYSHEVRPYSLFMTLSVGMLLVLNRWFRHPSTTLSILIVLIGILGMYTHYYFIMYMGALTISIALLRPWYQAPYRKIIGLFALIGLAFLPQAWIVYKNTISVEGGIPYALSSHNLDNTFDVVYAHMKTNPQALGIFLLLLGILKVCMNRRWFDTKLWYQQQIRLQYLLIPSAVIGIALVANILAPSMTTRNLIIILPPLAILAALGTTLLDYRAVYIVVGMLIAPAPFYFEPITSNGPYAEVANVVDRYYEAGGQIMVDANVKWQHAPLMYYLMLRTEHQFTQDVMTFFGAFQPTYGPLAELPLNPITSGDVVAPFLAEQPEQIFWVQGSSAGSYSRATRERIAENYIAYRVFDFNDWNLGHTVTEYRRIPDEAEPIILIEDNVALEKWELSQFSADQCETIELETWWQASEPMTTNYSMTFVLVDANGNGIVQNDGSPANILTQLWATNQYYLDERSLTIPCDLPSGSYPLLIGWYDLETTQSLNMTDASDNPIEGLFYVTNINVE